MKFSHIILLIAILAMAVGTFGNPGLFTAINAGGVSRLVNKVLPPLFEQVKHAQIPECHDGHHHITGIHVPDIGIGNFAVAADPSGVVVLQVTQFHCEVNMHYKYKRGIIKTSANVRVRIGDGYFHLHVRVFNNNGNFGLEFPHVAIDAGEASVKISGGLIAKFLNAVKSLFKSRIKRTILDTIRGAVQGGLGAFAQAFVGGIPLRFPISSWGSLDLGLNGPVRYEENRIIVGFNAEIQGPDGSGSGAARHNVPFHAHGKLFDIGLDTFVFNSAFSTFFNRKVFNHVCTKANPNGFPEELTTTAWGQRGLPAIQTLHPNAELNVVVGFREAPVITSTGGHAGFRAIVTIDVNVGQAKVFRIEIEQTAAATAAIIDRRIIPQITGLQTKLSIVDSAIGNFTFEVAIIQSLVNFANGIAAGVINNELLQGIPLPMTDKFALTDVSLVFPENAFAFACDIDFNI